LHLKRANFCKGVIGNVAKEFLEGDDDDEEESAEEDASEDGANGEGAGNQAVLEDLPEAPAAAKVIDNRVKREKQLCLGSLGKVALTLFTKISIYLLNKMATEESGTEMPFVKAYELLPGIIASEAKQVSKKMRVKHVNAFLQQLLSNAKVETAILKAGDDMYTRMLDREMPVQIGVQREWDDIKNRVVLMVENGNNGAAMELLLDFADGRRGNEGQAKKTAQQVRELIAAQNLFPAATDDDYVMTMEERMAEHGGAAPEALQVTPEVVQAVLLKLQKGKAGGQSGWTFSLLTQMASKETEFSVALTAYYNRVLKGDLADEESFTLSRIALFDKPEGGNRPICVGSVDQRVFGKCVMVTFKAKAARILEPHQFGIGKPNGMGIITTAMSVLAAEGEGEDAECLAFTDISNAFGTVQRGKIADLVWEHCPELYPIYTLLFSNATTLVLASGETVASILTGVPQGNTLSSFFFCLLLKKILDALFRLFPSIFPYAYLDDCSLRGPRTDILAALRFFFLQLKINGMTGNGRKSKLLNGGGIEGSVSLGIGNQGEPLSIQLAEGAMCLGVPIGSPGYVERETEKKVKRYKKSIPLIEELPAGAALELTAASATAMPMHLARNLEPRITMRHLNGYDNDVDNCISHFTRQVGPLSKESAMVRALPTQLGGLGIVNLTGIASAAYVANIMSALVLLKKINPTECQRIRVNMPLSLLTLIAFHLPTFYGMRRNEGPLHHRDYGEMRGWVRLPGEIEDGPNGPVQAGENARANYEEECRGISQRRLTEKHHIRQHEMLVNYLRSKKLWPFAAQMIAYAQQKRISRWIRAVACKSRHFSLETRDYLHAIRRRLLVPVDPARWELWCFCRGPNNGKRIDTPNGHAHLLTCHSSQAVKATMYRHDMLCKVVAKYLKTAGYVDVGREVEISSPGKPTLIADVVYTDPITRQVYYLDVQVTACQALTSCQGRPTQHLLQDKKGSAYDNKHATSIGEDEKMLNAAKCLTARQLRCFSSFVVLTTGKLGDQATAVLKKAALVHQGLAGVGNTAVKSAQKLLLQEMGTIVARGGARIEDACIEFCRYVKPQGEEDGDGGNDDGDGDDGDGGDGSDDGAGNDEAFEVDQDGGVAYDGNDSPIGERGEMGNNGRDSEGSSPEGEGGRGLGFTPEDEAEDELSTDIGKENSLCSLGDDEEFAVRADPFAESARRFEEAAMQLVLDTSDLSDNGSASTMPICTPEWSNIGMLIGENSKVEGGSREGFNEGDSMGFKEGNKGIVSPGSLSLQADAEAGAERGDSTGQGPADPSPCLLSKTTSVREGIGVQQNVAARQGGRERAAATVSKVEGGSREGVNEGDSMGFKGGNYSSDVTGTQARQGKAERGSAEQWVRGMKIKELPRDLLEHTLRHGIGVRRLALQVSGVGGAMTQWGSGSRDPRSAEPTCGPSEYSETGTAERYGIKVNDGDTYVSYHLNNNLRETEANNEEDRDISRTSPTREVRTTEVRGGIDGNVTTDLQARQSYAGGRAAGWWKSDSRDPRSAGPTRSSPGHTQRLGIRELRRYAREQGGQRGQRNVYKIRVSKDNRDIDGDVTTGSQARHSDAGGEAAAWRGSDSRDPRSAELKRGPPKHTQHQGIRELRRDAREQRNQRNVYNNYVSNVASVVTNFVGILDVFVVEQSGPGVNGDA
jgi:hypothetical protein